ncbi:DoxX family protein [Deinococcus sp. D7000]|uniref:DoxX family protein n=1 Tax=Deinococcus radiopugnans ATCC 19172 TaxID=585398 RepID=A0A5C4YAF5_9DEIO|nr:DoxX family protein [Deinococcus radiopugnans]MBB6016056.1 thiosulfate dehydrogenase [quinone] large subunit [Deinococcus radiopugnans ATCC 19172]QLG11213.1 DoxX family protein [Deinococcus sp. D7000]TNM72088.1 DoxX family protein [Deinococcus radiopugnans ATCC 19172]
MTTLPPTATPATLREPAISRVLFADPRLAPLWLILRLYVGYEWLSAGWGKITNPAGVWVGEKAGVAVSGFLNGAVAKSGGDHPDVAGWYAWFVENVALPNATVFSYMVAYGELLVGIALILGLFTGIAAFFGGFLNANFLLAGTVSSNPLLFILATWLVLGWRVAGWWGLDRWILPRFGVMEHPDTVLADPVRPRQGDPVR